MLRTRERSLLLEQLRPPAGYELSRAIATTYTLDLAALLSAPLAFTYFNYHDEEGEPTRDPVALLEALRRHAEKITIFCQAGEIAVPKPDLTLLSYVEGSVVQVRAPRGGIFHPKLWLLRFTAESGPTWYRLLCLSRNLTFDRAWDTCLCLEGELTDRQLGFGRNRPLGDFIATLPDLAPTGVAPQLQKEIRSIGQEVRGVRFEEPWPFKDIRFHPLGMDGSAEWPFPRGARSLVASPFLTEQTVERLGVEQGLEVLVSRPESLESLPEKLVPEDKTFVLSSGARMDAQVAGEEEGDADEPENPDTELTGIHAKIYLIEENKNSHLFVGSANATTAAFRHNVEFLVELIGGRWKCGIETLLGSEDDTRQDSLRSLLQPWERPEVIEEPDKTRLKLERELERLASDIASARLSARVKKADDEHYDMELRGRLPRMAADVDVWVWPATLGSGHAQTAHQRGPAIARLQAVSFQALTGFWAFKLTLEREQREVERRFVIAVPLRGAPSDRRERLLRSLLSDPAQVLRLLLLLLSDEAPDVTQLVGNRDDNEGSAWSQFSGWEEPALLESLLQALSREPRRVDEVARLVRDLSKTPEGQALLPAQFEDIWGPVWAARRRIGSE